MSDPLKPTGFDNEAIFAQRVHERNFGPSRKIRNTRDVRISNTRDGIFIRTKARPTPSAPAAPSPSGISIGILTGIFDNYIVLRDMVSNATVRVAKMYHLRNSIGSEKTLDGTVWTFAYQPASAGNLAYVARTKSTIANGGYSEYQRVTKVYQTATDQISYKTLSTAYATAINIRTISADTGIAAGTLVTFLEDGPWRMWSKKIDQTVP